MNICGSSADGEMVSPSSKPREMREAELNLLEELLRREENRVTDENTFSMEQVRAAAKKLLCKKPMAE